MDTPIFDFVNGYAGTLYTRLHMPGHKGVMLLGMESMDITEITGADSLYEAGGIIARSEENASRLFGCPTFYSTEGSSLCIRAMLYLLTLHSGGKPVVAAARNVHKSFLSAAALLDLDVRWIWPNDPASYLACRLDPSDLDRYLTTEKPTAVYVTSPDYLGNVSDIAALAQVCHRHGVLLMVDNAHGAYLRFLHPSRHPMDLGADICCDSAHKTLPVLTGGAYLHISPQAPAVFLERVRDALALFGSTSPSYLILQSLDVANSHLESEFPEQLAAYLPRLEALRQKLEQMGWEPRSDEPMKITLHPKAHGLTGTQLLRMLHDEQIECEFADPDHLVMMFAPRNGGYCLERVEKVLRKLPYFRPITQAAPAIPRSEKVLSIRQATLSPSRCVPIEQAKGRILATPGIGCPPAVPIVVCGERIDAQAIEAFQYYGITECRIVDE